MRFSTLKGIVLERLSDNAFQSLTRATCTLTMEYGEMSTQKRFVCRATTHNTRKPPRASNSLFTEASSARAWRACVLDQSAQSSVLGGRTSTLVVARSSWLLGQVGGSLDWALDVCVSSFFV